MEFLRPDTWTEALAIKTDRPDAVPIAGGTDVMVELNFGHRRPAALLDLTRIAELTQWTRIDGRLRIGAGVSYTRIITELAESLPGLAMASRTVGSPQIRNRGTLGGNLGAASPAGDTHPVLLACDADIELASTRGSRLVPAREFYLGVKRTVVARDELIAAVHLPPADGPQQFTKVGTRNAMVIAVCSFGLRLSPSTGRVGAAIGSAAPTPLAAVDAAEFLTGELAEHGLWESPSALPERVVAHFGKLVSQAASPIDDARGSAAYRKHALAVLARRALGWAWSDYREGNWPACA